MCAVRSSSSRNSESRELRRSNQVSIRAVCHNPCAPTPAGQPPTRLFPGAVARPLERRHLTAPMRSESHPMTLTQKILAAHAGNLPRPWVQSGDVLQVSVDWTIASELAWNGMERTYGMLGRPKLHDKDRFFLAVDHTVDPVTLANDKRAQKLVQLSRTFAKESGIRHFYDANQTILHTRFYRDLVRPGDLVLGADSHTSSHGGLGALSIGLGGADVVVAMVLVSSWIQVPEAVAIEYAGTLPCGIAGKDVILRTLGLRGR